jgi:gas vesicle protein GvpG
VRVGLFTGLLTLPLAPVRGVTWVAEQLLEEAERQLYDERNIRRELMQLEMDYEDGKIGEHERDMAEQSLMERLAVSHARAAPPWEEADDG